MPQKRLPSNEVLKQLYVDQKATIEQIAISYHVTKPVVRNKLIRIGLRQPNKKFDHHLNGIKISDEELKHLYVDEKMSISQLVPICGIHGGSINKHLKKLRIFRSPVPIEISDEELTRLVVDENMIAPEISQLCGMGINKIYLQIRKLGLIRKHKRKPNVPYKLLASTEELKRLYVEEKKSCITIAKMYGVNATIICKRLKGVIRPKDQQNLRKCKPVSATQGYPLTYMPSHPRAGFSGYVFTHVLVMEQHTGITPTKDQPIHHIDFDRKNNNIQNLYLCSSDKEHFKFHHGYSRLAKELFHEKIILFDSSRGYYINPKVLNSKTTI